MLDDEEEELKLKPSKKEKRKKSSRRREDNLGADAPSAVSTSKKAKRGEPDSEDDELDAHEALREADLADRDAFAERLKNKDKGKQKQVGGMSSKRAAEIAARREDEKRADRKSKMKDLRVR